MNNETPYEQGYVNGLEYLSFDDTRHIQEHVYYNSLSDMEQKLYAQGKTDGYEGRTRRTITEMPLDLQEYLLEQNAIQTALEDFTKKGNEREEYTVSVKRFNNPAWFHIDGIRGYHVTLTRKEGRHVVKYVVTCHDESCMAIHVPFVDEG